MASRSVSMLKIQYWHVQRQVALSGIHGTTCKLRQGAADSVQHCFMVWQTPCDSRTARRAPPQPLPRRRASMSSRRRCEGLPGSYRMSAARSTSQRSGQVLLQGICFVLTADPCKGKAPSKQLYIPQPHCSLSIQCITDKWCAQECHLVLLARYCRVFCVPVLR